MPLKCLERIIPKNLLLQTEPKLDHYQFAYHKGRCTDDAILTYVNTVIEHLEKSKSYVRTVFIDFRSAFNTIKPDILIKLLIDIGVSSSLCSFIIDFLTDRKQRVRLCNILSGIITLNTGSPQGCVLSAFLFIIYTNLLKSSYNNISLVKYADDTVISGLIINNAIVNYQKQVSDFVSWCTSHSLILNVKKTKELILDFSKSTPYHEPLTILGEPLVDCLQQPKSLEYAIQATASVWMSFEQVHSVESGDLDFDSFGMAPWDAGGMHSHYT